MNYVSQIKNELEAVANAERAAFLPGFFQDFPGGDGESDRLSVQKCPTNVK